jgi:hypothetical protein
MKKIFAALLLLPVLSAAQLPVPLSPDFLKPPSSSAQVLNSTAVTLAENNFRIVEPNVIAKSRGFKLLGFITLKKASHTIAMSRLYEKAQVETGRPQTIANVVHESGSMYLILFSIPKVTIRADLIEFTGPLQGTNDLPATTVKVREREP